MFFLTHLRSQRTNNFVPCFFYFAFCCMYFPVLLKLSYLNQWAFNLWPSSPTEQSMSALSVYLSFYKIDNFSIKYWQNNGFMNFYIVLCYKLYILRYTNPKY